MPASLDRVLEFAHAVRRRGPEYGLDAALARGFDTYRARAYRRLAGLRLSIDGRELPTLYAAILEGLPGTRPVELTAVDPPAPGPAWEYLRPFRRIELLPDGTAELHPPSGPPQHAIARVLLRESSLREGEAWTELLGHATFPSALEYLRTSGTVPFGLALLLYFSEERVRFEIDLTDDALLKDPRAGRLPPARRHRTRSRTAWAIDRLI